MTYLLITRLSFWRTMCENIFLSVLSRDYNLSTSECLKVGHNWYDISRLNDIRKCSADIHIILNNIYLSSTNIHYIHGNVTLHSNYASGIILELGLLTQN